MTTKVPTEHSPAGHQSPQVSLTINPPQRSMCQSTSDKSIQLESCYISLQAVTLHPQPRCLSPANISQQPPCLPQQQYPDLELGQIVHRRKPTPPIIPSKVPPKFSPAGSMNKIFGGTFLDLYHLQQCRDSRRGQIVHRRNQSYHPFFFPKQGFRPLHYQAEHPPLPQDGYILKYHNIYHAYIIHKCHNLCIYHSYTSSCIILCIRLTIFYQSFSCFLQSR